MFALSRGLIWVICATLLAACQEDGPMSSADAVGVPDLFRIAAEQCTKDGGRWSPAPGKATHVCYTTPRDAGKLCRVASDCEGHCLARSRTCSPIEPFYGCHEVLTDGGIQQTLCIQ